MTNTTNDTRPPGWYKRGRPYEPVCCADDLRERLDEAERMLGRWTPPGRRDTHARRRAVAGYLLAEARYRNTVNLRAVKGARIGTRWIADAVGSNKTRVGEDLAVISADAFCPFAWTIDTHAHRQERIKTQARRVALTVRKRVDHVCRRDAVRAQPAPFQARNRAGIPDHRHREASTSVSSDVDQWNADQSDVATQPAGSPALGTGTTEMRDDTASPTPCAHVAMTSPAADGYAVCHDCGYVRPPSIYDHPTAPEPHRRWTEAEIRTDEIVSAGIRHELAGLSADELAVLEAAALELLPGGKRNRLADWRSAEGVTYEGVLDALRDATYAAEPDLRDVLDAIEAAR